MNMIYCSHCENEVEVTIEKAMFEYSYGKAVKIEVPVGWCLFCEKAFIDCTGKDIKEYSFIGVEGYWEEGFL